MHLKKNQKLKKKLKINVNTLVIPASINKATPPSRRQEIPVRVEILPFFSPVKKNVQKVHTLYYPHSKGICKTSLLCWIQSRFLRHRLDLEIAALLGFVPDLDNAFEREPQHFLTIRVFCACSVQVFTKKKNPKTNPKSMKTNPKRGASQNKNCHEQEQSLQCPLQVDGLWGIHEMFPEPSPVPGPPGCWQMSARCFTVSSTGGSGSAPRLHPVLARQIIGNPFFPQLIVEVSVELGWSWGAFLVINLNTTPRPAKTSNLFLL